MAFNNGFPVGYPQMNYQGGWNQSQTGQFRQQQQTNPQGGMNGWNPQSQFQPNQPQYQPQQQYQPQPFDNTVQSLQYAENYPVAPGVTVTLMDASGHTIYVKTADASGRAMPVWKQKHLHACCGGFLRKCNKQSGGYSPKRLLLHCIC